MDRTVYAATGRGLDGPAGEPGAQALGSEWRTRENQYRAGINEEGTLE